MCVFGDIISVGKKFDLSRDNNSLKPINIEMLLHTCSGRQEFRCGHQHYLQNCIKNLEVDDTETNDFIIRKSRVTYNGKRFFSQLMLHGNDRKTPRTRVRKLTFLAWRQRQKSVGECS